MPSYRRHVARHPRALERARRYILKHGWETGPLPDPPPTPSALQEWAASFFNPKLPVRACTQAHFDTFRDTLPVPVGVHCSVCKHEPHGGEAGCHCGCRGVRLPDSWLPVPKIAPAECPECSHAHVSGERCTHSYGSGGALFCGCTA